MAEHVLEFSSVSKAKDYAEKRINQMKQSLDIRLGQILVGLSEIESEVKIDDSACSTELESLKGYRQQTISLFGPNAPNIETIDNKISEIESQLFSESRNKPIKLKWDDTEFLVLISELGYVDTSQPLAPPNTNKSTSYDDVIIPTELDLSETEHNYPNTGKPASNSRQSFGDVIGPKPFVSRKPANTKVSHSNGNACKSLSIDSTLESKSQMEVLRFMSLAPDIQQTEDPTGPQIPIRREPSPKLVFSRVPSPKVENSEQDPGDEYTDMSQSGSYCVMSSDISPPQTTSPPALYSTSLPLQSDVPLSSRIKKRDSSRQDGTLGPRSIHDYEEIDISIEIAQPEKNPSKICRFPRFPSVICCPEGSEKGQIMKPKAVCVNRSNGNLYVAEKGNSRVQVFSPKGDHLSLFAEKSANSKMVNPYGICLVTNQVYVTQSSTHCVHIYTLNGGFVKKFGKEGSTDGKFKLPSNITASQVKKQIYVCDTGNDRVQAFDFSHNFSRHFGVGQLLKPVDIELDSGGRIVVLDRGPKCIHLFSIAGERLFSLIAFSTYRQVINPLFFTLDQNDVIYLSDYARNSVFVFSMDGGLKGQIGEDGVFVEPRGLVFDNSGRLVVVSCTHTGCLQFYDL